LKEKYKIQEISYYKIHVVLTQISHKEATVTGSDQHTCWKEVYV